jgi:hypothetical protein
MHMRWQREILLALIVVLCIPAVAVAQSQITGVVKDESGGVLPGVSVEAASPVLIEKIKTAVTDADGRYRIVDLRPGVYKITFTLSGFSTLGKEGVELPSNFTSTINVELKVGALEETVTVSGETSVVDVQQASRTQVITRDLLDNLPVSRTIQTIGMPIPGIRMSGQDVGGSLETGQNNMSAHGMQGRNNTLQLDGLQINSQENNGEQFGYLNDALNAEVTVSTYASSAEVSGGGIKVNTIPRDGGNSFSGSLFLGGSNGSWRSDNADPSKLQGVVAPVPLKHIQNFTGSIGGPILRDRVWFFFSPRHMDTTQGIINGARLDGKENFDTTIVRNLTGRLTYQLDQKNKISATQDRVFKVVPFRTGNGIDPSAAYVRAAKNGIYNFASAKWTSTVTNRWLLESGYSQYRVDYGQQPQPGDNFARGTSDWYADAQHTNNALIHVPECVLVAGCLTWHSPGTSGGSRSHNLREVLSSSASFVTGAHSLKTGLTWSWGYNDSYADMAADLVQQYLNGAPNKVVIYNTPYIQKATVKYDLGLYIQDTWTIKRLTLNPGLRIENFNSFIPEDSMAAGRFVPVRFYPAQRNLPNWNGDLAPRFSAAYDLFGDGKTAIKGNISKYYEAWTGLFASRYSPVASSTSSYNWADLNGDDIAQENEFIANPGSNANFGKSVVSRAADSNEVRAFNRETSLQITRQLRRGVSVNLGWFHRIWKDVESSDNTLTSQADWMDPAKGAVAFQYANPMNPAEMLNAYQLNPAVRGQSFTLDYTNKAYRSIYDGFELSFQSRLENNATVFGGVTFERNLTISCGAADDPNATGTDRYAGFTVAAGLQGPGGTPWCDQHNLSIPFSKELKLSGAQPVWLGATVGATLMSLPGSQYVYTYALQNADFPGKSNTGTTQNLLLTAPGAQLYPRFFQLDMNLKKNFRWGSKTFSGQVDLFNVTNSSSIISKTTAVTLTGTGSVSTNLNNVTAFLLGRTVRLAFQMKF